jgi:hypothetical protein
MELKRFFLRTGVFCAIVLVAQVVVSLDYTLERNLETGKVHGFRLGIPEPYEPKPEILAVQQHQRLHDRLGFLWKPLLRPEDKAVVAWGDSPAGVLTTDSFGFANTLEAIDLYRMNFPVDVVGVGASFMGGAQAVFHEYFSLNGLFYYNMGHGRFTLPQYNIAIEHMALPMKPRWIVYGLNEASNVLIPDFEAWEKSGMDWYAFHSGTWAGPARKSGFPHDQLRPYPAAHKIYRSVMKSLFRGTSPAAGLTRDELVDKTWEYVLDAYTTTTEGGSRFVLLLIPAKHRMTRGPSSAYYLFEALIPRFREAGIPYIDLRENFSQVNDPSTLYYKHDGHWNTTGIYRAAREVIDYIEKHDDPESDNKDDRRYTYEQQ